MSGEFGLVIAARPDRHRFLDEIGLAIGHHQFGRMGQLGEAGSDARHRADPGGDDLAAAAKGFGTGKDAEFSESRHQNTGSGRAETAARPPTLAR